MFDDLDSDPPSPADDARAAVARRAGVLRRRRQALLAGSGAALALTGVLIAQNLTAATPRTSSLVVVSPTTPAPAVSTPTPTGTPTPTPTPSASSPTPVKAAVPTPTPTPTCGVGVNAESCPDGKPGWFAGMMGCEPTTQLARNGAGTAPAEGVTLAYTLAHATVRMGTTQQGTLTFTNHTQDTVSFAASYAPWQDSRTPIADVLGPGGGGAIHTSDAIPLEQITLAPNATASRTVDVPTVTCGDTSKSVEPPLSPGTYGTSITVNYANTTVSGSSPSPAPTSSSSPDPNPTPSATPKVNFSGAWSAATTFQITR